MDFGLEHTNLDNHLSPRFCPNSGKIQAHLNIVLSMLTAKAQYDLANAEKYFREHLSLGDHHADRDYYSQGKHVMGQWFGLAAERLKLRGDVKLGEFLKLCRNANPQNDELLTQRLRTNRRVFYDFTLSPPKSVSIVALVCEDNRVEQAHERATMSALRELEKFAAARVRIGGASNYRNTSNIVSAVFPHDTSRALDPHLHSHCVVFNATYDATEQRWKALETYEMLRAAKFAENVYYHELAQELHKLGYKIQNNSRGDFEIEGVSSGLVKKFSKRHQEIDDNAEALLESSPDKRNLNIHKIRAVIAHDKRARKIKDIGRARLSELWDAQLETEDVDILSSLKESNQTVGTMKKPSLQESVVWSEAHLFDRKSVVSEYELWRYALEHGRGQNFSVKSLKEFTKAKAYIRDQENETKVTTQATLERERLIIEAAKSGINQCPPFNPNHHHQISSLDTEQRRALNQILSSKHFLTLFRGGAGTGKTFTLKAVREGLVKGGHKLHMVAPQRQQVIELRRELGCEGQTLSEFLERNRMSEGDVVIVDEAGQIGAEQMLRLIGLVQRSNGRIILSGDTRQHGAVEASDALRAIERFAGIEAIELKSVRRQNPNLGRSDIEKKAIAEYRQAVIEAREGKLAASFDRLNKLGAITQCGFSDQYKFLTEKYFAVAASGDSVVVVSQTWSELQRINEEIRTGLKERGTIGKDDVSVTVLIKQDLTNAQKRDKRFYSENSVLYFNQKVAGIGRGTLGRLLDIRDNELIVHADGKVRSIIFNLVGRITVCKPQEMPIASGDRLQLKANGKTHNGMQIANGELVTVKRVEKSQIKLTDGRILPQDYRQFMRGYAVTSYAAQGKTADFVIFLDSAIKTATNQNQWYVTISRGRKGIHIFTTDKQQLKENVAHSGNRELAMEISEKSFKPVRKVSHWLRI